MTDINKQKVVLAYSGGLDTSYCVAYLKHEQELEVHTALVNTGGFEKSELKMLKEKALKLGAASHKTFDLVEDFYQKSVKYLIFGNVLKNDTYPLSVSAERAFQAMEIANYANQIDADYVAHGSTGAGNDQIRFDMVFQILAPEAEILSPIRDQTLSREQEMEYLSKHGIKLEWDDAKYSINKGLWGTSVGGAETLTSHLPLPETAWPNSLSKKQPLDVTLEFEEGEIKGLDGSHMVPVSAIQTLTSLADQYAIGRDIHVGDTIIGIKGRVGFEASAALILIKAHHTLEKHVLSKWQQYWKGQLAEWYGMLLHEGQYLEPLMRDIETFMEQMQRNVSGKVHLTLSPYRFQINGIESDNDLMNSGFGDYGELNKSWSGEDAKGFATILSNQMKIYNTVHNNHD
ncbi:argininosuccinate synthase [Balneolaceae bacterium YR4-1]|uniref:argininosuccinate synthase n=1 Tax=Halalkalibaculum roseum TaxID=2709311 RepID=A0A6M1SNX7_9BACT|nr:argininosuccinate synthase domain-containing protein [Halalkalibaculum roseum]NGP77081.1 argininosuccinate synthase [Halalkalibaculum roseum]